MNKYKTFEELKEELGDKFEEYMYKSNIELLTKIDKVIFYMENYISVEEYNEPVKTEFKIIIRKLKGSVDDE